MKNGGSQNYTVNNAAARLCGRIMAFQNILIIALIVAAGSQV